MNALERSPAVIDVLVPLLERNCRGKATTARSGARPEQAAGSAPTHHQAIDRALMPGQRASPQWLHEVGVDRSTVSGHVLGAEDATYRSGTRRAIGAVVVQGESC